MKIAQYNHPFIFKHMKKLGKYFPVLWKYLSGVCESCGKWAGFESVISRHGFQCDKCNEKSNKNHI
jgi:hypothetical protein